MWRQWSSGYGTGIRPLKLGLYSQKRQTFVPDLSSRVSAEEISSKESLRPIKLSKEMLRRSERSSELVEAGRREQTDKAFSSK